MMSKKSYIRLLLFSSWACSFPLFAAPKDITAEFYRLAQEKVDAPKAGEELNVIIAGGLFTSFVPRPFKKVVAVPFSYRRMTAAFAKSAPTKRFLYNPQLPVGNSKTTEAFLEESRATAPGKKLWIGHSMGGLVLIEGLRTAVKNNDWKVLNSLAGIVTIQSPHGGSRVASFFERLPFSLQKPLKVGLWFIGGRYEGVTDLSRTNAEKRFPAIEAELTRLAEKEDLAIPLIFLTSSLTFLDFGLGFDGVVLESAQVLPTKYKRAYSVKLSQSCHFGPSSAPFCIQVPDLSFEQIANAVIQLIEREKREHEKSFPIVPADIP